MTDDTPIEELPPDDDIIPPQAEQKPSQPPQNGNGHETETISDLVRKSREAIPVGERGITPTRFEDQIVHAKALVKAHIMLPEHLHDNVAVMVALVGIAARFNLDPAMLATQTYVQNKRLCFQSQAFGAILYASKLLFGRLRYEFHGEGDEITCTVSGRFRDDPDMIYSATTPPLKLLHPGYSQKDGKTYVKGSPLWDKDSEQQLAYFAQRRWIRRYAPDCVMGMYTREEIAELDEYRAQRDGAIPLTADRLGQLETGEGWGEGAHVDLDLASISPELPEQPEPEPDPPKPAHKQPRAAQRKPVQGRKPIVRSRVTAAPKTRPRGRQPAKGAVQAAVKRAENPPRRPVAPPPKWLDYVTATEPWIKSVATWDQAVAADTRWETERELRDKLNVPIGERSRLRATLDRKVAQFKPKEPEE
jgi:RecT family